MLSAAPPGSHARFGEDGTHGSEGSESTDSKPKGRGFVEGFTIVLLMGWLILVASFAAMYYMDEATKKAAQKQTGEPPQQRIVRRG